MTVVCPSAHQVISFRVRVIPVQFLAHEREYTLRAIAMPLTTKDEDVSKRSLTFQSWTVFRPIRWSRRRRKLRDQDLWISAYYVLASELVEPRKWRLHIRTHGRDWPQLLLHLVGMLIQTPIPWTAVAASPSSAEITHVLPRLGSYLTLCPEISVEMTFGTDENFLFCFRGRESPGPMALPVV